MGFRVCYACCAVINLYTMVNAAKSGNWPLFYAALLTGFTCIARAFNGLKQE